MLRRPSDQWRPSRALRVDTEKLAAGSLKLEEFYATCTNTLFKSDVGGEGDVEISFIYTNVTIMLHHFAETPLR